MTGGFSTPKKDKMLKVSGGQRVKIGQILSRFVPTYKAGRNVTGLATIVSLCDGVVQFSRKKTSHGKIRTFISVIPDKKQAK